jgi:hypothetical protein
LLAFELGVLGWQNDNGIARSNLALCVMSERLGRLGVLLAWAQCNGILVCYAASYASKFEAAEIDQLISNTIASHVTPHVSSTSCAFSDAVKN